MFFIVFVSNCFALKKTNIIIIYVDDLGYGDVSCYNPQATFQTPSIDRMAAEGIRFVDGHSGSTTCTPFRYLLMTGKLPYRSNANWGTNLASAKGARIQPYEQTIAHMLKEQGYRTGIFGKWHLGLTLVNSSGEVIEYSTNGVQYVDDLSTPLVDGASYCGFDNIM